MANSFSVIADAIVKHHGAYAVHVNTNAQTVNVFDKDTGKFFSWIYVENVEKKGK